MIWVLPIIALACSCDCGLPISTPFGPRTASDPDALLDRTGNLSPRDERIGLSVMDRHELTVAAGEHVVVTASSSAFDPALVITVPGGETLSNDDFQGSREHSQLAVLITEPGLLKIAVTSHQRGAHGRYRILVRRAVAGSTPDAAPAVPLLSAGGQLTGEVGPGDQRLADGRFFEQVLAQHPGTGPLELTVRAAGITIPLVIVIDPQGRQISQSPNGAFALTLGGTHRIQVETPTTDAAAPYSMMLLSGGPTQAAPVLARNHHQLPTTTSGIALTAGQQVEGTLVDGDAPLPSGELADIYVLNVPAPMDLSFELSSAVFDPYLLIVGPNGQYWENDDAGGTTNAALSLALPQAGPYRVVATSYQSDGRGTYVLKTAPGSRAVAGTPMAVAGSTTNSPQITGMLAAGDATLPTGEWVDTHRFEWPPGQQVTVAAHSTTFDTYLILRPPTGTRQENDDGPSGGTDAALSFVTAGQGTYEVMVTSYQPGEQGAYTLEVTGAAPTAVAVANPASIPTTTTPTNNNGTGDVGTGPREIAGSLTAGDQRLQGGEYADHHELTFAAGESVHLALSSTAFDSYLIVNTPSGRQLDNDDVSSGTRDAGLDIPVAEAGTYRIVVTSYQAGEQGAYVLRVSRGATVPRPDGGGSRVFGLFAGISDYPGGQSDLPECANDALKLAEALRESQLLNPDRQIVLTDGQATVAGLRAGMARMATMVGAEDIFVFFYSGHGGQAANSQDVREIDGTDEYLALYDGRLMDDELGQLFDRLHARVAMVAIDACYSGGFAKDVITRPGRMGLFSSEEDVLSAVAGQFQAGGYLSYFLRTAVSGAADTDPVDRVLTAGELTHYVYSQFGQHATDVHLASAYQHLVVDRGAVRVDQVLWSYR